LEFKIDLHLRQRDLMAERDQVLGLLGSLNGSDAGYAKHIALFEAVFANPFHGVRLHHDPAHGYSLSSHSGFGGNIHHGGFATAVQMGEGT
jgi:hypothetical protein